MCNGISIFKGCGGCVFSCYERTLIEKLDILSVTRLCVLILWHHTVESNSADEYTAIKLQVNCSGTIIYNCKESKQTRNSVLCSQILTLWCKTHVEDEGRLPYIVMVNVAREILLIKSIHKLRTKILDLEKFTETITTCNKYCKEIVLNKEISKCTYRLCNLGTKVQCNERNLAHILCTILHELYSLNDKSLTIDDTKLIVCCDGSINLTKAYVSTDKAFNNTKNICIKLLRIWCSKSTNLKVSNARINRIINRLNDCNNILDIHSEISTIINW